MFAGAVRVPSSTRLHVAVAVFRFCRHTFDLYLVNFFDTIASRS